MTRRDLGSLEFHLLPGLSAVPVAIGLYSADSIDSTCMVFEGSS
jgi:hypothetical protein